MLEGIIRESISKASTKALRNDGYLVANIYGKNKENIHCAFKTLDFIKTIKAKTTLPFSVRVAGKEYEVVVQEFQRDPVSSQLLHVDLLVLQKGVEGKFKVPVKISGNAKGLKNKGVMLFSTKRINVKCKPENLPNAYELDVSDLDTGDSILVRDLAQIDGVKILNNADVAVVGIIKAK